jgi:hypothetical protein
MTDPYAHADFIFENAERSAKAKSARVYLQEFRKTKKAILMAHSTAKTAADREVYAYSHPDYLEVINCIKLAVEEEELLHWQMVAAQARIEIWRSQEASNRQQDRTLR